MIKAVLFDFGQTLADASEGFRLAEREAQEKIYSHIGLGDWDEFLSIYRLKRREYQERSIFSRNSVWEKMFIHYKKEPCMDLLRKWEDEYWDRVKNERKLYPETMHVLSELSKIYKLAIITNSLRQGYNRTYPFKEHTGIEGFFKEIVVAGEGDIPPKPDPKPFHLSLSRLGIMDSEAVFVGDDWAIDICGAKNADIQPIWVQHDSVKRVWPQFKTEIPIINTLEPLLSLESILDPRYF